MGEKGFSFVELAIATGIFITASLGITKLMLHVSQGISSLIISETAFSQLQQKLNDFKSAPASGAKIGHYLSIRNDEGGSMDAGEISAHSTKLQLHWQVTPWSLRTDASGKISVHTGSDADNTLKEVTIALTLENGESRHIVTIIPRSHFGSISDIWHINSAATP